jgi:hypothetical protein
MLTAGSMLCTQSTHRYRLLAVVSMRRAFEKATATHKAMLLPNGAISVTERPQPNKANSDGWIKATAPHVPSEYVHHGYRAATRELANRRVASELAGELGCLRQSTQCCKYQSAKTRYPADVFPISASMLCIFATLVLCISINLPSDTPLAIHAALLRPFMLPIPCAVGIDYSLISSQQTELASCALR